MAFFNTTIEVPSYAGTSIHHTLSGDDTHNKLMVLLPGQGYYVDAPLLHFMRKTGWSLGYNVLAIRYGFQVAQQPLSIEDLPGIQQENQQAIDKALEHKPYEDMVIVGKSLGTPMTATFANELDLVSKIILLTPIQDCHKMVESTPALAVIGTADPRWKEGLAVDTDHVTWRVFDDLNHSLEYAHDVPNSIQVLGEIMAACEDFLTT